MSSENSLSWPQRLWESIKNLAVSDPNPALQAKDGHKHGNEFIVMGLGRFGTSLAMTLTAYGHDVLAVDLDMKRVQEVSQILPHVVQLDVTKIEALREIGVETFDTGIVCIGTDFEANLLGTVSLRKLGVRRVISKARTVTQQEILLRVGADEVILPEHEAGVRLARRLSSIDFVDFLELGQDKGIVEIITPEYLVGKSLREAQIRQRYGLAVVAIRRVGEVIISPQAEEVIEHGDILVILGEIANCEKLR